MRLGIQSLGSMLWGDDICSSDTPEDMHSLTTFLYVLRGLLRKSLSACIITVPAHLIQVGILLLLYVVADPSVSKKVKVYGKKINAILEILKTSCWKGKVKA